MGFLLGMAMKLSAGRRLRNLQYRLANVMRSAQQVSRQISNAERNIASQEKNAQRVIRMQSIFNTQGLQAGAWNYVLSQDKALAALMEKDPHLLQATEAEKSAYSRAQYKVQEMVQEQMQSAQMQQLQQEQVMQQEFEMMRACMVDSLKDEQEYLEQEKASLESQIQLAKQDYESAKQMEKDGAKDFVPEYTGQG